MNKDKAIQLLERLQEPEPYEPMLTKDAYDAIQMAIDALSADGDTISREAAIEVIDSFNVFESRSDQIKLEQMIGELPPAQPDVPDINVGDMISRQAAIDICRAPHMRNADCSDFEMAIMMLPPAQPEPSQLGTNLAEVGTDCISRQAAISAICNACGKIDCDKMDKCEKLQLPPANCSEFPNNSDTISRQAAIDAFLTELTKRERKNLLHTWSTVEVKYFVVDMLEKLPPAQPEPCEDAVSRKDCLQALSHLMDVEGFRSGWAVSRANVECMLKSMPPVTPKQRTGHWIPVGVAEVVGGESAQWGSAIAYHKCSECDEQALRDDFEEEVLSKWCPHCGVKMEWVSE